LGSRTGGVGDSDTASGDTLAAEPAAPPVLVEVPLLQATPRRTTAAQQTIFVRDITRLKLLDYQ
jgi:hypothetical protein